MDKKLVSWLLPVYNCQITLNRAMDSMLNQTYKNFEIIIVLEYGTDEETKRICRKYKDYDDRVRIIENREKLGIAESLNVGLKHCNGQYIARMDADDYSYPERLEKQVMYMENHPDIEILGANTNIISEDKQENRIRYTKIPDEEEIKASLLFGTCFMHPTIMFRNTIKKYSYPKRIVEDYGLFANLISELQMAILPDVILDYYESNTNTSKVFFNKVRVDSEIISREVIKKELGISTEKYDSSLFGWRNYDDMPENPKIFLIEALELYHNILFVNEEKSKFDNKALLTVLNQEWRKTLQLIYPYNLTSLYKSVDKITEKDIEKAFFEIANPNYSKKVIVYGIGYICKQWINMISEKQIDDIVCFCDSDVKKQGTSFLGKEVIAPECIHRYDFDFIAIASVEYEVEIKENLKSMGFEDKKIGFLPIPEQVVRFHQEYSKRIEMYESLNASKQAFLFCAADYGNIGDHAIAEATHGFVKKYYGMDLIEVPCIQQRAYMKYIEKVIKPEDIIFISGGGFLGSLWISAENNVREVIARFPKNKIIILPQTLYWEPNNENQIESTRKVYEAHRDSLLLCARDKKTEQLMKMYYPECNVILVPDMVLSQTWDAYFNKKKRTGILLCLKDDKESILIERDKTYLKSLGDLFGEQIVEYNTNLKGIYYESDRKAIISEQLECFAGAELVITDRLHGLLFAVITGTPCIALNNCNHKIRETFNWVKEISNIRFANSIHEVEGYINELLQVKEVYFDYRFWHSEFKKIIS